MTAPAVSPLLEGRNLERRFGASRALRGVSLTAFGGECHLVVGPNGAGKTTLLRMFAGLARPSAGVVLIDGSPMTREPSSRRTLGLLSHQSHLYDELTTLENLTFLARLHGLAKPAEAALRGLESVGLASRAGAVVRSLSRGMVQRVAIAGALLHGPRVLLLDEPFTGLDPSSSSQVAALLAAERQRGSALILVTHDVHESWELATHVHLLVGGLWASSGPRQETLDGFLRRYREVVHG